MPFRNSALTMFLKDSLVGNCMMSMVATISVENSCLEESLSTSRFAIRCQKLETSLEKNLAFDNERQGSMDRAREQQMLIK